MKAHALIFAAIAALHSASAQAPGGAGVFQRFDKNGDGKVTKDELPNAQAFSRYDLNKDGVITLEEYNQVAGGKAAATTTAPGSPTSATAQTKPTTPTTPTADTGERARAEQMFKALDKNGDGVLTEDELPPQAKRLTALDRNKDGRITKDEAIEMLMRFSKRGAQPAPAGAPSEPAKAVVTGPSVIKGGDVGVGRQVADVAFTTLDGKAHRLSELRTRKGVVIAMTSTTCPVSKRYAPSLARLEKELAQQNVALLLVNPFASDKPEDIAAFMKEQGLTAPYVHDSDKSFAAALHARSTTEVLLLDSTRTLLYRGALDDQYGLNYNLDAPRVSYLREAVAALLAGKQPEIAATDAPGCELDLPAEKNVATTEVTYHRDVARILQQNCVQCHHDRGIAPFALDDIAEVKDRAKTIRRVIEQRQMPPWFAAPIADSAQNPWANDCSLSARDKADLLAWLGSANRPLGNPADAPVPLKFTDEWSIGKPDLIVQLPKPFDIKAEGTMPYQFTTAPTTLTEDKWVTAYEIMPTAREVVHHVIVQVHEKGTAARDRDEGTGGFWAAYVPGNASHIYPAGFARKLPAGATVSFQIHYTPNGKAVKEQMRMGLVFAKTPPLYAVKTLALADHDLNIAPGAANHVESSERRAPFDLNITSFMAHMHVRGKAFKYEVTYADGKTETLLDIPHYDFNWQLRYDLKQPKLIPRGSTMKVTAIFDNSPANKANPDPTKLVKWGPQTYDEMMIGYVEYFTPIAGAKVAANAGK